MQNKVLYSQRSAPGQVLTDRTKPVFPLWRFTGQVDEVAGMRHHDLHARAFPDIPEFLNRLLPKRGCGPLARASDKQGRRPETVRASVLKGSVKPSRRAEM